ncbi:MAG: hypothetical protein IJU64_05135 [Bacilli bacterium]|nr:hypothetical protein [Bacilli bacterium]
MNQLRALICLSPLLLASCGGPSASDYFSDYGKAGENVKTRKAISISSNNTTFDLGFVNQDGKTLRVTSKPMAFVFASDTIDASSFDNAGIAITMSRPTNDLNTVSVTGTMLEESGWSGFSSTSLKIGINAYLKNGGIYVDMTNSALLRAAINTLLAQRYENAPTLATKDALKVRDDIKTEINDNLPLTQYVSDSVADQVKAFGDMYTASSESFAFSEDNGKKTISVSTSDKASVKALYEALVPSTDTSIDIDQYLSYCQTLSFSFSAVFVPTGVETISFAMNLDGFDLDKIKADHPDAKLFPVGPMKLGSTLTFAYDEAVSIHYLDFTDYKEIDLTDLKEKTTAA